MSKVLIVMACAALSACSLFGDRSEKYEQVYIGDAITLPAELHSEKISPLYPIPSIDNQRPVPVEFELPQPPDATAAIIIDPFKVETALGETWLQLFDSPSDVWPLLDLYWREYSLDLVNKDTTSGFMATLQLSDASMRNTSFMDVLENSPLRPLVIEGMSFQLQIVHGVRRNTTEVRVRALLPNQNPKNLPNWLDESINPRLEKALLNHIGEFVTSDAISSRHSFLANEIGGGSRVRLLDDIVAGQALELRLSLPRAKNEIEQALVAAGVIIAENDLSNNKIYVSYVDEEELESWYHTTSMIESRKLEKNILVSIEEEEPGLVFVRAEKLNEDVDLDNFNALLTIIFEHIS